MDDWLRSQVAFRAEMRMGFAFAAQRREYRESMAAHLDTRIATMEHAIRSQHAPFAPFSRPWWRGLRIIVRLCVLAEYHRAAGTERVVVMGDPRAFAIVSGLTS